MSDIHNYIESGVLETYVLGLCTEDEKASVQQMAALYPEIQREIALIELSLEEFATIDERKPSESVRALLMASIDYSERVRAGEVMIQAPMITKESKITDYSKWLQRPDFQLPQDFNGVYARIINASDEITTAIVWIKDVELQEIHHDEYEKFLIVEGNCIITIGDETHNLTSGDQLDIPLFKTHAIVVTSDIPCKAILQRIAA